MDPQLCTMQQQGGMPRLWRPWWQLLPVTLMSRTPMATQHCILLLPKVRLLSIFIIIIIIVILIITTTIIIIYYYYYLFATVMQRTPMPHAALYLAAFRSQNAASCDSDVQNFNANTALHLAASRGQATGSCDCFVQNPYTYTALHVAAFQDQALLHVSSCSLLCCAVQKSTVTQHCICVLRVGCCICLGMGSACYTGHCCCPHLAGSTPVFTVHCPSTDIVSAVKTFVSISDCCLTVTAFMDPSLAPNFAELCCHFGM